MNDCSTLHIECNNAYERIARSFSDLAEAFYDLAQSAKFHCGDCSEPAETTQPVDECVPVAPSELGGGETPKPFQPTSFEQLDIESEPDRGLQSDEKAPRVVTAKTSHLLQGHGYASWNATRPLPTSADARACSEESLPEGRSITISAFTRAFREYCKEHGLAQIDQVGIRYLLYSSGHEIRRVGQCRYVKRYVTRVV